MESQSSIAVSFKQNPALGEALAGKSVGDEGSCEVTYTIKELTPEGAVLNIEAIVPEGYEVKEEGEPAPMTQTGVGAADDTIPTALSSRVARK